MDELMSPTSSAGKRKRHAAHAVHRPMSPIERLQAQADAEEEDLELDDFRHHKRYITEVGCAARAGLARLAAAAGGAAEAGSRSTMGRALKPAPCRHGTPSR
jgi:hypothetical protein